MNRTRRGFSLVEALVALAFVGTGIASALGGLAQLNKSESSGRMRETEIRLACQKMDEVLGTHDYEQAPLDGDFSDEGESSLTWSLTSEPGQVENMLNLRLTVSRSGTEVTHIDQLVYQPPTTTEVTN